MTSDCRSLPSGPVQRNFSSIRRRLKFRNRTLADGPPVDRRTSAAEAGSGGDGLHAKFVGASRLGVLDEVLEVLQEVLVVGRDEDEIGLLIGGV